MVLRPVPSPPPPLKTAPGGISHEDLAEIVAQNTTALGFVSKDLLGLQDTVKRQADLIEKQIAELAGMRGDIKRVERVTAQNARAVAQLVSSVETWAKQGRERDAEIEKRADEARRKASGAHKRIASWDDWSKEREEAEEITRRQIDSVRAEQKRQREWSQAITEAKQAGAAERKPSLAGPLAASPFVGLAAAIVAKLSGQQLLYAFGVGLSFCVVLVVLLLLIRKSKP